MVPTPDWPFQDDGRHPMERMSRPHHSPRSFRRSGLRIIRVGLAVLAGVVLGRALDVLFGDNWASVVAHQLYRSGQLTDRQLRSLISQVGLKSVINLRGASTEPWYAAETRACRAAGIRHYNIALSAQELPEPGAVLDLLRTLREAPRPVLVHCKNGADRTGLASALYLMQAEGSTVQDARSAGLCVWRGHIPVGGTGELDRFLDLYRALGSGKSFERWVQEDYTRIFHHEWRPARPTHRAAAAEGLHL